MIAPRWATYENRRIVGVPQNLERSLEPRFGIEPKIFALPKRYSSQLS